jgi:hypothetical protein
LAPVLTMVPDVVVPSPQSMLAENVSVGVSVVKLATVPLKLEISLAAIVLAVTEVKLGTQRGSMASTMGRRLGRRYGNRLALPNVRFIHFRHSVTSMCTSLRGVPENSTTTGRWARGAPPQTVGTDPSLSTFSTALTLHDGKDTSNVHIPCRP